MKNVRMYLDLYPFMIKIYFKSIMSYKRDFFIGLFVFISHQMFSVITVFLIFQHVENFNGWSFYEILFLQGFVALTSSIGDLVSDNLWDFAGRIIVRGDFDRYLVRPINSLFFILIEKIQIEAIGSAFISILIIMLSALIGNLKFSILKMLIFLILSVLIIISIKVIVSTSAFTIKKSRALLYLVFQFNEFSKYPLTIYPWPLRIILFTIFPFGFASYLPVNFLLFTFEISQYVIISIATVFLMSTSFILWEYYVNKYTSTGT